MECEVCGAPEGPFLVLIEGAKLHACERCARMGKIISAPREAAGPSSGGRGAGGYGSGGSGRSGFVGSGASPSHSSSLSRQSPEWELVENFGDIIRAARLRMKLPLAVLAERLSEKESFLERVEGEKTHPSAELARHLEKELNVKLLEASEGTLSAALESKGNSGERTLGDVVEIQKKKKKEE